MNLVGQAIKHNAFGNGIITDFSENTVTVCFSQGDKKFLYPDAFARFLIFKDKKAQLHIDAVLNKRLREENAAKQLIKEEQDRLERIRTLKIIPNSQAAFQLDSKQIDDCFTTGTVSTGHYLSGYSKGEPRIPKRLRLNSACVLTELPKNASEKERRIVGVFMVRDDFDGSLCRDGIIESHQELKIRLNPKESSLFWDYFDPKEAVQSWGNIVFKYFSNITMQRILLDIKNARRGKPNEQLADSFYNYFCEVNRLPLIESPARAL